MSINAHSHIPIYEQIVAYMRGRIAAGTYRPDEPLPSIRSLALELTVNPNTVQRAYQELERQGLVYPRRGLGMFVSPTAPDTARQCAEDGMKSAFREGIDVGRAARLEQGAIRAVFDHTMSSLPHEQEPTDERSA